MVLREMQPEHGDSRQDGQIGPLALGWQWQPGDRLLSGASVDRLLDANRGRKFALTKRPIDPFPQPIRIGRSCRWIESQVIAWIKRQIGSTGTLAQPIGEIVAEQVVHVPAMPSSLRKDAARFDVATAKRLYEGGRSLDVLCKQMSVSKVRLLKELHAAGTRMRAPGRPKGSVVRSSTHNAFNSPGKEA